LNVIEAAKALFVATKNDFVFSRLFDTNTIVREAVCRVEIENKQQPGALEHQDFIYFMFEGDIGLWGG